MDRKSKWDNHPANIKVFDFLPSKNIGRYDRNKQAEWAEAAANMARIYSRVRIFEDVCLYSKEAMIERCELLPEPARDYNEYPYWLIKELTWDVIAMQDIQDIAGFFYWNTNYWEKIKS